MRPEVKERIVFNRQRTTVNYHENGPNLWVYLNIKVCIRLYTVRDKLVALGVSRNLGSEQEFGEELGYIQ